VKYESRIMVRVLALVGAVAVLSGLPQPADTLFWNAIYDAGHAPLFGFVALSILSLLRIVLPKLPTLKLYLLTFVATIFLGAVTELAQFFTSRDADLGDFIRNAAGAAAFLTFRRLLERGPDGRRAIASSTVRVIAAVLAAGLFLAVFIPVGVRLAHYRGRNSSFPMLCSFGADWTHTFVQPVSAGLEAMSLPAAFGEPAGTGTARWTFYSRPWPGLALQEPYPDWTGYRTIRFEIWSGLAQPVAMTLMAEDRQHHPGSGDRARVRFTVEPGRNDISIDLDEIRKAPPNRALLMDQVGMVMLYTGKPEEPFTLWIGPIRLE